MRENRRGEGEQLKQQQNIAEQDKHRELKAPGKVAMSMLNKRTKPNQTEPNQNPTQHSTAQRSTEASPSNPATATHPATCAIAMGMLLFTAFKLVEREIKKPQAGAEAAEGVGGGGGGTGGRTTAVPVGGKAALVVYLLISPQSLVCWLAFLCPVCPFMQDIISHC